MVTIMRHFLALADLRHSFDDVNPLGNFDILTINVDANVFDYAFDLHGLNKCRLFGGFFTLFSASGLILSLFDEFVFELGDETLHRP